MLALLFPVLVLFSLGAAPAMCIDPDAKRHRSSGAYTPDQEAKRRREEEAEELLRRARAAYQLMKLTRRREKRARRAQFLIAAGRLFG
jgi:hypothetical protein